MNGLDPTEEALDELLAVEQGEDPAKGSCEGIPLGSSRNFINQSRLARPNFCMATKSLAPAIVAQTARNRMSQRLWR
jgi:hypothetical protein